MTIIRDGQPRPADEAFQAWTSNDMSRMLQALNTPTHPIDRHFLLQAIVNQAYKERGDPEMLRLAEEVAWKYVSEFESLVPAMRQEFGAKLPCGLPQILVFKHLATILVERGTFSKAIEVCEYAMQFGLSDGTKGGFDARIQKIRSGSTTDNCFFDLRFNSRSARYKGVSTSGVGRFAQIAASTQRAPMSLLQ